MTFAGKLAGIALALMRLGVPLPSPAPAPTGGVSMATTATAYRICDDCLDHNHDQCTLGQRGGKEACGCDHAAHPDAGRRAMHTRTHPDPDLGPTAPATPDGTPPMPVAEGVHVKPGATVVEGAALTEGDAVAEGDATEKGGA